MKKLMITATILVSSIFISYGQDKTSIENPVRKNPEERAHVITDGLAKKLALSADQRNKVYQISLDRAKKMNELQAARKDEQQKQMEVRRNLQEESEKKLDLVLTEGQKKIYRKLRAEKVEKFKERRNKRFGRNKTDFSETHSN